MRRLQTVLDGVQVSAQFGAAVPCRILVCLSRTYQVVVISALLPVVF